MKINRDYFVLNPFFARMGYFVRQRNVLNHLLDRIKWHYFPKLFITPRFPSHIDIEISSICQLKCPMCGQRLMKKDMLGTMDLGLFKKIIDECARRGVYSVKLSWRGEPLLNPKIVEMVKYAKEKGIRDVAFLTNGERLNERLSRELIDAGLDWISFSVDGLHEIYEKIRYPAKFEKLVENIKKLVELRRELGKKKPLVRVQSIFTAIKDNPKEYFEFWDPIVDRVNFIADELRSEEEKKFVRDPKYVCPVAWQRMIVTFNGTVAQCHSDYLLKWPLGNVNDESLYEIWHGNNFKKLRQIQKRRQRLNLPACQQCCSGGLMKKKKIDVGRKKMRIAEYVGQDLDVKKLDARKVKR